MATNGLFVASHAFAGASTRCMLKKAMIRMLNDLKSQPPGQTVSFASRIEALCLPLPPTWLPAQSE
jgi:hypothetical protein